MDAPFIKVVNVAAPVAGAEFALTARGGEWWRVISVTWTFTTDANVANRAVALVAGDGTDTFWRVGTAAVQAAGQTGQYCAYAGAASSQTTGGVSAYPLPFGGLWLQSGWSLRSLTDQVQVGDAYTSIRALVQEYQTGPDALLAAHVIGALATER